MERKNTEKKSTENKKDKAFVAVVSGLTSNQAGELARALINAKQRYAPKSRGTIATGNQKDVGNMIQGKKTKRISKNNGKCCISKGDSCNTSQNCIIAKCCLTVNC